MAIAALPKETTRRITSSLALNDAASVVKELVDNALDSRADAISVELSVNTLDVIQVKDNGSGIGVEDRQLLCKRGCTSKIRSFEDLTSLGGTFLGFRGEALASVAELSGSVTVTTRIGGEVVGTALKFGWDGKLLSSSSASHPVGTTVRVQNFLSNIPVRRQSALKTTSKTITRIQKLLHAYGYARPETRLSFKVLKAKDGRANWTFAPSKSSDSLLEIASKIAGKEVADQCSQHTAQSGEDEATSSYLSLQASVISPTSDVRSACNSEQYFSVDQRPVSADKGLMKELSKTYKEYLRSSLESGTGAPTLNKPFLVLRVSCPPYSYDVNVEPAKDEVMFCNSTDLRDLFNKLMRDVYGDLKEKVEAKTLPKRPVSSRGTKINSFELLLATRPSKAVSSTSQELTPYHSSQKNVGPSARVALRTNREDVALLAAARRRSKSPQSPEKLRSPDNDPTHAEKIRNHANVFAIDHDDTFEDEEITPLDEGITQADENDDTAIQNPWLLAKLNIRIPPKRMGAPDESASSVCSSEANTGTKPSSTSHRIRLGGQSTIASPPRNSQAPFQNPGPPMRPWARRLIESDDDSLGISASESDEPHPHRTSLDTWVQGVFQAGNNESPQGRQNPRPTEDRTVFHSSQSISHRQQASASDTGPPLRRKMIHNNSQQQRLSPPFKTPFKQNDLRQNPSPVLSSEPHTSDPIPVTAVSDHQAGFNRPSLGPETPPTSSGRELDDILEFERRKRLVIAQHKRQHAFNGSKNHSSILPSPSDQPSASGIDGAATYAAAFPRATSRPGSANLNGREQEDFESKFGNNGPTPQEQVQQSTPPRSNPHHNRYLAASRNLSRPQSPLNLDAMSHAHPETRTTPERDGAALEYDSPASEVPKIPDSDPRAYFIRFRQQQQQQTLADGNGLTRTGLKIRRAKIVRLPLEATPVGAGVHDLAVEARTSAEDGGDVSIGTNSLGGVKKRYATLGKIDEYIKTGNVDTVVWSRFSRDVGEWNTTIKALVKTNYRLRVLNGMTGGDSAAADASDPRRVFEFEVNLSRALKAFVDGDLA